MVVARGVLSNLTCLQFSLCRENLKKFRVADGTNSILSGGVGAKFPADVNIGTRAFTAR